MTINARLESQLVRHCSPTLAGLKSANLFNFFIFRIKDRRSLDECVAAWNRRLNEKDVFLTVLKLDRSRALIYVYRKKMLTEDLRSEATEAFLSQYGYQCSDINGAIERLKGRFLDSSSFPHEVGLFLGYPLHDVVGFINNRGKACTLSGCWKVYSNEDEARARFERLRRCRDEYLDVFNSGISVDQLTAAP